MGVQFIQADVIGTNEAIGKLRGVLAQGVESPHELDELRGVLEKLKRGRPITDADLMEGLVCSHLPEFEDWRKRQQEATECMTSIRLINRRKGLDGRVIFELQDATKLYLPMVNIMVYWADFNATQANFLHSDFSYSELRRGSFKEAEMQGLTLRYGECVKMGFQGAQMSGSKFGTTSFRDCDFTGACLIQGRFANCSFYNCDFSKTDLSDALFVDCIARDDCLWPGETRARDHSIVEVKTPATERWDRVDSRYSRFGEPGQVYVSETEADFRINTGLDR